MCYLNARKNNVSKMTTWSSYIALFVFLDSFVFVIVLSDVYIRLYTKGFNLSVMCRGSNQMCLFLLQSSIWLLFLWAYVLNNQEIQKLGKYLNFINEKVFLFRYSLIAFNNWFCLKHLYRKILQIDVRKLIVIVSEFLIYWGNWNPTSNTMHEIYIHAGTLIDFVTSV